MATRGSLKNAYELSTRWGRVTHICIGKIIIIGSDNGLSPDRCQAIIWTNVVILLIRIFRTQFSEILTNQWNSHIFIQENAFENVACEMASILSQPQCIKSESSYNFNIAWKSYLSICAEFQR